MMPDEITGMSADEVLANELVTGTGSKPHHGRCTYKRVQFTGIPTIARSTFQQVMRGHICQVGSS
jgi:hypothetical protein